MSYSSIASVYDLDHVYDIYVGYYTKGHGYSSNIGDQFIEYMGMYYNYILDAHELDGTIEEFERELQDWVNGKEIDYLDEEEGEREYSIDIIMDSEPVPIVHGSIDSYADAEGKLRVDTDGLTDFELTEWLDQADVMLNGDINKMWREIDAGYIVVCDDGIVWFEL